MKKVLLSLLFGAVILTGCGSNDKTDTADKSSESKAETSVSTKEVVSDKFADETDKGEGTFNIAYKSGSTADGEEVVVFYDKNTFPTEISVITKDIDGSKLSYIYADGQLVVKEQLGDSQRGVQIQDVKTAITEGDHKLQLVQYEDDKEDGTVVTFKEQPYTIKLK